MKFKNIIKKIEMFNPEAAKKAEEYARKWWSEIKNLDEENFDCGISFLFPWCETVEGAEYWVDINEELRDASILTFKVNRKDKSGWVKKAQAEGLKLNDWIVERLNK